LIDPRAVIDPSAKLHEGITVGPYAIIGPDVEVGPGTWIGPHVVINGPTRMGRQNRIHQFASLGDDPQDKKYGGERTWLDIGDRNVIREYCTMSRGTVQGGGATRIGHDNWIMAYVHIAHDCQVGNDTVFANGASLAGHVRVDDRASLGGFTLVHQFCRIGSHSFSAFSSVIKMDVPPYILVSGNLARPHGINVEGLRRHGFSVDQMQVLRNAYKILYRSGLRFADALARLHSLAEEHPEVAALVEFLRESGRGIVR
jgi:UDP-N-acetylglucosamine acyltransferase